MPFFKQFGKSWFEKNFKMTSFIHKLSTNGNTAYSKSITIKMIHDPSVIFPLIFYCQRHRYDLNTLLPKTRGVPWVGCSGGGCGYPHASPSFTAAQGMLHSPRSMCQVLGPPARTTAWATPTSTASAHSITLKMSIIRRYFPFPDVAISTFSVGKHLVTDEVNSILLDEPMLILFFKHNWSKTSFLNLKTSEIAGLDLEVCPCPDNATYISIYISLPALADSIFYQVH